MHAAQARNITLNNQEIPWNDIFNEIQRVAKMGNNRCEIHSWITPFNKQEILSKLQGLEYRIEYEKVASDESGFVIYW